MIRSAICAISGLWVIITMVWLNFLLVVQPVRKPKQFYHLHDKLLIGLFSIQGNGKHNVLPHSQHRNQIVILKHKPNVPAPEDRSLLPAKL